MSETNPIYKGAAKRIDDIDLPRIGAEIGVGEDVLHALIEVETRGTGFDDAGRVIILFEPHIFYSLLKHDAGKLQQAVSEGLAYPSQGMHPYPHDSYPRLIKAMAIDETAALESASWGMGQVMGENFRKIGYSSVQDMVRAFAADEETHLQGMVDFLKAAHIDDDLRRIEQIAESGRTPTAADWVPVVRVYNGAGYAKNDYHNRAARAFAKWQKIKDTPFAPETNILAAAAEEEKQYPVEAISGEDIPAEPKPTVPQLILVIGDSMGEGITPWMAKLFGKHLISRGDPKDGPITFKRGTMTSFWLGKVRLLIERYKPDKVLILLGTNDANNNVPAATVIDNVGKLIEELEGTDYLWAGPPASPKIDAARIERTVNAIKSVVGDHFYDTRQIKPKLKFYDELHPYPAYFGQWANELAKKLKEPTAAPVLTDAPESVDELAVASDETALASADETTSSSEEQTVSTPQPEQQPAPAKPADDPVTVQKVAQSLGSKVMAAGIPGGGFLLALWNGLKNPYVLAALVVCALVGAWLWNQSKKRQQELQLKLVDKAADKDAATVAIAPSPAKAG